MFGKCPGKVILDFDTARLKRVKEAGVTRVWPSPRCAACDFRIGITSLLRSWGIECEGEHEHDLCQQTSCNESSFHGSPRCANHIANYLKTCRAEKVAVNMSLLQKTFDSIACQNWHCSADYEIVRQRISEISTGKRPGSALVVLDDEFSQVPRKVLELAIIERVSGRVLINTAVEHQEDGMDRQPLYGNPYGKYLGHLTEASISRRSRKGRIGRMDVHSIAQKLRSAQISKDTIILVWHQNVSDLTLLREFLEAAGYDDILPTDKNCIPMINILRPNFSAHRVNGRKFPLKLEVLFPTMFPSHPLVGQNHQALADCQQTRLICQAFDKLCQPVEERSADLKPADIAPCSQQSITDWAKRIPTNENGESISCIETPSSDWTDRET